MCIKRTRTTSFMDKNGDIDIAAYRASRRDNGEECWECGSSIFMPTGKQSHCAACEQLHASPESVNHPVMIRCPHCGHASEAERPRRSGPLSFRCDECKYSFSVYAHVTVSLESPPLNARVREIIDAPEPDEDEVATA